MVVTNSKMAPCNNLSLNLLNQTNDININNIIIIHKLSVLERYNCVLATLLLLENSIKLVFNRQHCIVNGWNPIIIFDFFLFFK